MIKSAREIVFLFLVTCVINTVAGGQGNTAKQIRAHEFYLRKKAITSVVPKYPLAARKDNASGVAVSQITIDENGQVLNVEVLQSPHPSIEAEVKEALYKWRFSKFTINGKPYKTTGKLTFYFIIEKGRARVEGPNPYVSQ